MPSFVLFIDSTPKMSYACERTIKIIWIIFWIKKQEQKI